jgi:lipoprotein-anchoring transpeptidase ErfK/SrfK
MTGHRREVRPRYGRIAALATSVTTLLVAALAGTGMLGTTPADAGPAADTAAFTSSTTTTNPPATSPTTPSGDASSARTPVTPWGSGATTADETSGSAISPAEAAKAVPAKSGTGRRIVFSQSLQRVWLVDAHDAATRTYLVSGSVTDNLQPGTYDVTRRARHAVGIEDSGTMEYFVVFTAGPTGAAIGFHSIPVKNGKPLQTAAQLGTPRSHGCIRQRTADAIALWHYAPLGTKVVVVA